MNKKNIVLEKIKEYANMRNVPIVRKECALLLAGLVKKRQPVSILEVGTAVGYSALLMASYQLEGAKVVTIEKDAGRLDIAREFFKEANALNNIETVLGDAGEIIPRLNFCFDFVFIDGAKGQYLDYLQKAIDKLAPGAVIVADNILFRGYCLGNSVVPRRFRTIASRLKAYLEFVNTDPRFKTVVYQCGDGVAVSEYVF